MKKIILINALVCLVMLGFVSVGQAQTPSAFPYAKPYPNDTATGTAQWTLTKINASGNAVKMGTADVNGYIGVCVSNCGTTGTAWIAFSGLVPVTVDATATIDDYITISTTTAGDGHDTGATTFPKTGLVAGRVQAGATSGNQAMVDLFAGEIISARGTGDLTPNFYAAGGGTAQAQTVTLAPAPLALVSGLSVCWKPTAANTAAAPTLAVNGLTATAVTKLGTTALVANDLTTTAIACAIYDGTQFELQNPQTTSSGSSSWSGLTAPSANLTLAMAGFTSEFDTTAATAAFFKWANTTAATSSVNQPSPILNICGRGWEGASAADAADCWTIQNVIANGANPNPQLTFANAGSTTGVAQFVTPTHLVSTSGTAAAPAFAWASAPNTGLWLNGGNPAVSAGGSAVALFTGSLGTVAQAGVVASQCFMLTTSNTDVQLCRGGAANPIWGPASATPTAYTHNMAASSRGGTDSNVAGANATVRPGTGTGNAALAQFVTQGTIKGSSGTTAQTNVTRETRNLQTTITTNNTAQTIMTATVASGTVAGGLIKYCVHMDNGTDFQDSCGTVTYVLANKAGVVTAATMTPTNTGSALTTGTLTVTWAASAATPSNIQVTANSSITPTVMRINWSVENFSDANDISVTSN